MKKFIFGGTILLHLSLAYAFEVVEVYYRDAQEVLSSIRPTLRSNESISEIDNKLIIDASPSRTQELSALIRQLDKKAEMLLVEVDQASNTQSRSDNIGAQGQIIINNGRVRSSGSADAQINRNNRNNNGIQTIRLMSGSEGFIELGHDRYYIDGQYRTVSQRISIVPKLIGNTVHIDVYAQNRGQKLATTTQGQLGQWINLGSINTRSEDSNRALLGYEQQSQKNNSSVRIRITKTH